MPLRKAFVTAITAILNILMYCLDVCFQISLLRKAFVTHVTIVSNVLMYTLDMSVQIVLQRKAFVTLFTFVSNILMETFYISLQICLRRKFKVLLFIGFCVLVFILRRTFWVKVNMLNILKALSIFTNFFWITIVLNCCVFSDNSLTQFW